MKTVFVYWEPHKAHKAWAEGVTNECFSFIPKKLLHIRFNSYILHQLISIIFSFRIPKADIYLLESIGCLLPVLIRKKKKSKIIVINDDPFFYNYQFFSKRFKKIYSKLLKKINGIISTSKYMDSLIKETKDIPRAIVPLYVDYKRYSKINSNIKSNDICFVSNQNYKKGTDILIKAFKGSRSRLNNKLYLIGNFEEKLKGLNDKDIIKPGPVKKPEYYLKKCGIYVNPARHEPFGINILEAMCAGLAPIVTNCCGAAEIVAKISNKLVTNPNPEEIKKAILWLDIKKRIKLGKLCKKEALKYTKEKSITLFKKKFENMIK